MIHIVFLYFLKITQQILNQYLNIYKTNSSSNISDLLHLTYNFVVLSSNLPYFTLLGGMQDYNYVWGGTMEVTFEISCCKFPQRTDLPRYWQENRKGLLHFIGEVHRGKAIPNKNKILFATISFRKLYEKLL